MDKYYRLVYAGGHHEIYCNTEEHLKIMGDGFGSSPISKYRDRFRMTILICDCAKYKENN